MPERPVDWYQVLQVWREASPETVENAYRRLAAGAEPGSERQQLLDEAYAVLGNRARRGELDRALEAADQAPPEPEVPPAPGPSQPAPIPPPPPFPPIPAPPAPPLAVGEQTGPADGTAAASAPSNLRTPEEPPALATAAEAPTPAPGAPSRGPSLGLMAAMAGVVLLALAVAGGLVAWAITRDGSSSSDELGDGDFDLRSMQLREEDVPTGLLSSGNGEFSNEEWAAVLATNETEVEAKVRQLEARGRIRGYRADFSWENPFQHFGKSLRIYSQSTLFVDEKAASASVTGDDYCGLAVKPAGELREFTAPRIGDESAGFQIIDEFVLDDGSGGSLSFGKRIETVVCFRTGRVVNAVSQVGLEGAEDSALALQLARKMLSRVDDTFNGRNLLAPAPGNQQP